MKHYSYDTFGTCSARIEFDIEDGRVHNVVFLGGCNGNLSGISKLIKGMKAEEMYKYSPEYNYGLQTGTNPENVYNSEMYEK
jgi:uncharacterized protein (TIGR03905 family)